MKVLLRLMRSPAGVTGLALTLLVLLIGVFAPMLAPQTFEKMSSAVMAAPSRAAWFGTDQFGRDVLSRTLYGVRISLQVAVVAAGTAAALGTLLGLVAGYFGGWVDAAIMRLMEILMAFPSLLLAIGIMAMLGGSLVNVMIAIGLVYLPVFARVARAPVLALREEDMVTGARALGASTWRILFKHILPNMISPVVVQASLAVSNAVLTEAALSYLGLGVRPPTPSLGALIQEGQPMMMMAPWLAIFPGLMIMLMIFAFNLLGDTVRDQLDPRLRKLVGSQS
ncbi:MAG: Dipeptide transport system permease protein DppC [Firmicutes bacterium]|nr:Dipeptide transport system permease protein DppC [Bacillota bacterium]